MRHLAVRDFDTSDLVAVKRIHDRTFPLPDFSNLLYMNKKVVTDNGNIIAAGLCRLTSEGIIILNHDMPKSTKTRALVTLVKEMSDSVYEAGMDECHVFVDHPVTCRVLERLGFVYCSGLPMVVALGGRRAEAGA